MLLESEKPKTSVRNEWVKFTYFTVFAKNFEKFFVANEK